MTRVITMLDALLIKMLHVLVITNLIDSCVTVFRDLVITMLHAHSHHNNP